MLVSFVSAAFGAVDGSCCCWCCDMFTVLSCFDRCEDIRRRISSRMKGRWLEPEELKHENDIRCFLPVCSSWETTKYCRQYVL
jgi:hypothetical protein